MDDEVLIAKLREILQPDSQFQVKAEERVEEGHPRYRNALKEESLAEPLVELLEREPPFEAGQGFMVHRGDGSSSGFRSKEAAKYLLRQASVLGSPVEAVERLRDFLETESADGLQVMTLWGVRIPETIRIGHDVMIRPYADLPRSRYKDWIDETARTRVTDPLVPGVFAHPPNAALTKEVWVSPLLTAPDAETDPDKSVSELEEIRLVLSCLGPSAPVAAAQWFQFRDPVVEAGSMYAGISHSISELLPRAFFSSPVELRRDELKKVVPSFRELDVGLKKRLLVALERLNSGLRRLSSGDKAIDLSIAFESLLTEKNERGEHTFKISLRAALLLDLPDYETRKGIRALVKALYGLRSSMVHDGATPSSKRVSGRGKVPSHEIVNEGGAILAQIIQKIVSERNLPDWNALELGEK